MLIIYKSILFYMFRTGVNNSGLESNKTTDVIAKILTATMLRSNFSWKPSSDELVPLKFRVSMSKTPITCFLLEVKIFAIFAVYPLH